jgi:predicted NodU family carbamoyl transferase
MVAERFGQVNYPHSLGLLCQEVTDYLGFLRSSDEYKVMALVSYGLPRYLDEFQELIRLGEDGQYTIAPLRLEERFGPARERGGPLTERHYDLARSLQQALEEAALSLARWRRAQLCDERAAARPWAIQADLGPACGERLWDGARRAPLGGCARAPGGEALIPDGACFSGSGV